MEENQKGGQVFGGSEKSGMEVSRARWGTKRKSGRVRGERGGFSFRRGARMASGNGMGRGPHRRARRHGRNDLMPGEGGGLGQVTRVRVGVLPKNPFFQQGYPRDLSFRRNSEGNDRESLRILKGLQMILKGFPWISRDVNYF